MFYIITQKSKPPSQSHLSFWVISSVALTLIGLGIMEHLPLFFVFIVPWCYFAYLYFRLTESS